jgi:hypothetical protein
MAVVAQTGEEIIKVIRDEGLQRAFFELETVEAYLESVGLPTEFKQVDGRCDTSEFWSVIHFPVQDVYVKITGTYDSYGQYEHYYNDKVTQVFPKQVTKTVYDK